MPVKGINRAKENTKKLIGRIQGNMTEKAVTEVLITGEAYAAAITPMDTSTLVNSMYRDLKKLPGGYVGRVGYMAEYAEYVHDLPGTLKGQPRAGVKSFETGDGKTGFSSDSGNFWDPNAEPEFLKKGFERDGKEDIRKTIIDNYKL